MAAVVNTLQMGTGPIYRLANSVNVGSVVPLPILGGMLTGAVYGAGTMLLLDMFAGPSTDPTKLAGMKIPAWLVPISTSLGVGLDMAGAGAIAAIVGAASGAFGMDLGGVVPMATGIALAASTRVL